MKEIKLLPIVLLFSCSTQVSNNDPIKGPIEAKKETFRQCYLESDAYLGRPENDKRNIHLNFGIIQGKPTNLKLVKSDFKDPNLHACLLGYFKKLEFDHALTTESDQIHIFNFNEHINEKL